MSNLAQEIRTMNNDLSVLTFKSFFSLALNLLFKCSADTRTPPAIPASTLNLMLENQMMTTSSTMSNLFHDFGLFSVIASFSLWVFEGEGVFSWGGGS